MPATDLTPSREQLEQLRAAVAAAAEQPDDGSLWDAAEERVSGIQAPEPLAELYTQTLARDLAQPLLREIAERSLAFIEQWFSDEEPPALAVLGAVFALDPTDAELLERLALGLTSASQWGPLMDAYDRALEATDSLEEQARLLADAARVAKDVAGDERRAAGYLTRLLPLRPGDAQLRQSLERLLEKGALWPQLIELWSASLDDVPPDERADLSVRIAECWLEKLHNTPAAVEVLLRAAKTHGAHEAVCGGLERIVSLRGESVAARGSAFACVADLYRRGERQKDLARVLRAGAPLLEGDARAACLRELAQVAQALGDYSEVLECWGELLALEPADETLLLPLAEAATAADAALRHVELLLAAAERAVPRERADALRARAAEVALSADAPGRAAEVLEGLQEDAGDPGQQRRAGAALLELLRGVEDTSERRLAALRRQLALLEGEVGWPEVVEELARLQQRRGEIEAALETLDLRLSRDQADLAAWDVRVEVLREAGRHGALVDALKKRIELCEDSVEARTRDLTEAASVLAGPLGDLQEALLCWRQLAVLDAEALAAADAEGVARKRAGEAFDAAAQLQVSVGDALSELWSDARGALDHHVRALRMRPADGAAQRALRAALDVPELRGLAADALGRAYLDTGDVDGQLEVLSARAEGEADPARRRALWLEAAALSEGPREDVAAAFDQTCQAFACMPEDPACDDALARLARAAERAAAYADVLGRARQKLDDGPRARALAEREAEARAEAGETEAARDLYAGLHRHAPGHPGWAEATCRLALQTGEVPLVGRVLVGHAAALRAFPAELVALCERAGEQGLVRLCEALAEALEAAQMPTAVAVSLWTRVGKWAEDHAAPTALVERAWSAAHRLAPSDAVVLAHLVESRRADQDAALFDALMAFAEVAEDPLSVHLEAARLAVEKLGDVEAQKRALPSLLAHASSARARLSDEATARKAAVWSATLLADIQEREGDQAALLRTLGEGAAVLPAGDDTLELGLRAAALAARDGSDPEQTLASYRRLFEQRPDHLPTGRALAELLEQAGRDEELLVVLQRALAASPREARGELRLWISRVAGRIESRDPCVAALRENLRELPGDAPTLDALEQVLRARDRLGEWHEVLMEQAATLRSEGDSERACELYRRAATLARDVLSDTRRALAGFKEVAEMAPEPAVFEALAALHEQRSEPLRAQVWLARLLEARPDDRSVRLRLAAALEAAEQLDAAEQCLRAGVEAQPASLAMREALAELLERRQRTRALADLLASTVQHVKQPEEAAGHARRAAELYAELGVPEAGVDMLEQTLALVGEERDIQLAFADALIAAGAHERARGLLEAMVEAYGRRRSPDRAELHLRLARLARAVGDTDQALAELDLAASMSRNDVSTLLALAALAEEAGEWDRAEKALRALLVLVRRAEEADDSVCNSEVQYGLHRIAKQRGQDERAEEHLQSAFDAAVQSEREARLFKRSLLRQGEPELLLRVLEKRLDNVSDAATEARVLADLAEVLEGPLDRPEEALDARLKALQAAPSVGELHEGARETARRISALDRYVETLEALLERARRRDDVQESGLLALRLGEVHEQAGSTDTAEAAYARVPAGSVHHVDAQLGLARLAGRAGDLEGERAVLSRLLEDEGIDTDARMRVDYRLVAIAGTDDDEQTRDAALDSLQSLLERYPGSQASAVGVLEGVLEAHPEDGRAASLLEEVCRQADDPGLLLRFLEQHARLPDASLELVREGAELARERDESERAQHLYARAVALAEEGPGLSSALWAAAGLSQLAREQGDTRRALDWLTRAVEAADGEEGFRLGLELAQLAGVQGDSELSRDTYARLLEREPADRRVYKPLLQLHRDARDLAGVAEVTRTVSGALLDARERNELRMDLALLAGEAGDSELMEGVLREALEDDPDDEACALLLADLLEQQGRKEDLADLLGRELETAHAQRNPSIAPLSLRMGALLAETRPDDALQVYRTALSIVPADPGLLHASVELLDPVDQATERARMVERLLENETPDDAPELALWLVDHAGHHGDEADMERALALAFRVAPEEESLRARLEHWYRERENWAGLCEMLATRAGSAADAAEAVRLLSEAAELSLERLGDHERAAELLRQARQHAPEDAGLLRLSILSTVRAGQVERAAEEVDAALEQATDDRERAGLFQVRAEALAEGGDHVRALEDLEHAYAAGGAHFADALMEGLERARSKAQEDGDADRERGLVIRALELADTNEGLGAPLQLLSDWVERYPQDVAAAISLASRRLAAEQPADALEAAELAVQAGALEESQRAAEILLHAARVLEQPVAAVRGLETAVQRFPSDDRLREHLARTYEQVGAHEQLARLLLSHLPGEDQPDARFEALRRAGALLVQADRAAEALPALEQAMRLKPDDAQLRIAMIDACIGVGEYPRAQTTAEAAMEGIRSRRSPELAELRQRMSVLCDRAGDQQARYEWLAIALEADMNNGHIAAETAVLAQQLGEVEVALKALRAVTMAKTECPMSKAEAFLRQAQIVAHKGETRRAALWAKKARAEDPELPGIDELLSELGA